MININPELVEKKDPPIITKIKYIKLKLDWSKFKEKPTLDMLLDIDNKILEKSFWYEKKIKKIETIIK